MRIRKPFVGLTITSLILFGCAKEKALEVGTESTQALPDLSSDRLPDGNLCAEVRSASEDREEMRAAQLSEVARLASERPDESINVAIGLVRPLDLNSVRKLAGTLPIREITVAFDGFVDGTTLRGTQRPEEDESLESTVQRLRENLLFDLEPRKSDEVLPGERLGPTETPERRAAINSTRQRIQSGELPIAAFRVEGSLRTIDLITKDSLVYSASAGQLRAMLPLDAPSRAVEEAAC